MAYTVCTDLPQDRLSPLRFAGLRVTHGLTLDVRDGTTLCLDLLRPDADGVFPVVLVRTPYDKVVLRELRPGAREGLPYDHQFVHSLVRRGYILAIQDVRGRFNSDGEWHPYVHEQADGHDTIEWIAGQPWCDGNVGMIGRSYVGYTQWAAAVTRPAALKAIVPIGAQPDLFASGYPIANGVFNLPMAELTLAMGRRSFQIRDFMSSVLHESHDYFGTLPVADLPRAAGTEPPRWWDEMMRHPSRDEYWLRGSYRETLEGLALPALNVSGWYDLTPEGALDNYRILRERGGTPAGRDAQRLVIGPWAHWADISCGRDGIDFGPHAVGGLPGYVTRFFDRWLRGEENGLDDDPRVHVFAMGANEWWSAADWPLPGTRYVPFYLDAGGRLSSDPGGGPPDSYRYDPADPVQGAWSMHNGPIDDRPAAARPDVLCYTSEPLSEPLDVVGPLTAVLYAASSAPDTDWHLRLVDVHPSGYAQFLAHGVLRARFRTSLEHPTLLEPGRAERFQLNLAGTANRFLPGHRIRVELTSSWFPRYERNLNTGADNNLLAATPAVAEQTVFHDADRASHVLLPLV